eukprot:TRINITY_DN12432_c0_g1_i1.p1 TRINITY_DN12432_c0_g1~~TRINITY_DN12432_c0_g1_i1.p1  ORF type:complete len:472 (-),score=48.47 TRINITY_DN12432_c0_g1_i1:33-1448(-)
MRGSVSMKGSAVVHVAACTPEFGWGVCEPLMVPLFLHLHVPARHLAICWTISPIAGMLFHPILGHLTDVYGRRLFVALIGLTTAAGFAGIPFMARLEDPTYAIVGVMLAYGLSDLGHALLLTPTRAFMNDLFEKEDSEQRCAVAGAIGRLVGMCLASFVSRDYAFNICAAMIATMSLAQVLAPSKNQTIAPALDETQLAETQLALPPQQAVDSDVDAWDVLEDWFVWTLTFVGDVSIITWAFFFTSVYARELIGAEDGSPEFWINVHRGSFILAASAAVNIICGFFLARIVKLLGGEFSALVAMQFLMAAVLLSFRFASVEVSTALTILGMPIAYQVILNTPFAWLETKLTREKAGDANRGRLTGWLNNGLTVGTLFVGVFSGPLIAAYGGRITVAFDVAATVNLAVGTFVALFYICRFLWRRRVDCCHSIDTMACNGVGTVIAAICFCRYLGRKRAESYQLVDVKSVSEV